MRKTMKEIRRTTHPMESRMKDTSYRILRPFYKTMILRGKTLLTWVGA
jgi:hypothetical protein